MKENRKYPLGVYIHIPFCKSKCGYCSFTSGVHPEKAMRRYFELLPRDIQSSLTPLLENHTVSTVYIGGGTPSVVPGEYLISLMDKVYSIIRDKPFEVTMEANPGDITLEFIQSVKKIDVTRISIGAQSFNDDVLKFLGRRHSASRVFDSFKLLRGNGFGNINLDLIYGVPQFGIERWESDLNAIIALSPEHVSLYALSVEEGTPFFLNGIGEKLDPDRTADEYHYATKILRDAGYVRYEISNFAKPGYECRHNLNYWHLSDYVGFGTGAASYIDGVYTERNHDIVEYLNNIERSLSTVEVREEFHGRDTWLNAVIMGMRLEKGIDIHEFKNRFGVDLSVEVKNPWGYFVDNAYVIIDDSRIRFGDKGIYVSNSLLSLLM